MSKRQHSSDDQHPSTSKLARVDQNTTGRLGFKNESETSLSIASIVSNQQATIGENLSVADPMERTFNNGATVHMIYESFMDSILEDIIMLHVFREKDLQTIVHRVRPDFPYPSIPYIVKKRFLETEKKLMLVLASIKTFFIIYLSAALFQNQNFVIVEVAYFEENNRKNFVIGCLVYVDDPKLGEDILALIHKFQIQNQCFYLCSQSPKLDAIAKKLRRSLPGRNNEELSSYLAKFKRMNGQDFKGLNSSFQTCLNLAREIESFDNDNFCEHLDFVMSSSAVIEADKKMLEIRMRDISKESERLHYYTSDRGQLDLLCIYELRKLNEDINELKVNLENLAKLFNNKILQPTEISHDVDAVTLVQFHKHHDIIYCRKLLESCLKMLNDDFNSMKAWANSCLENNPNPVVVSRFHSIVERVTPTVDNDLWISVLLIKEWMQVLDNYRAVHKGLNGKAEEVNSVTSNDVTSSIP